MGGKAQAQDWPNLNKYQNENTNLKPAAAGQKRIVFMGDSITEFWAIINSEYFTGKPYINRGISGQTTPQMLVRFRADVIALKPVAVVILAGINDIAGNTGPATLDMIKNNIFSMAELAKANQIKVILCSVLPVFDFPWKPNQNPAEKITALNELLKNYAAANGIVYLDYYSAMVDERKGLLASYSNDGAHPNKAGYQVMAPLAEEAITKVLLEK
ncbi:SGNH/GDSL hydrolase family protein [Flavobacterium sp. LT1R49]|uniref:SGNH/GDSL hydrolase family protein n=1 Tax=Flavobacterium arabinosi TaxID=3398737 RepID=UPI003A8497B6